MAPFSSPHWGNSTLLSTNGRGEYELFVQEGVFAANAAEGQKVPTGIMVKRTVRLGDCNFDYVEVLDGLSEGDRVLTSKLSGSRANKTKLRLKE